MSRDDLTLISYTVLVLIGRHGASPHDLVRMMRAGRMYHAAAPSQYYAEPKRLERLGLLTSSKEPGRTRERTVYQLTDAGVAALKEWISRPSPVPRLAGEPPVRIISADLTGEGPVRESLLAMRAEVAELRANAEELEQRASTIPHREKYLVLNARLAKHVLDAYERWLDEVDRELEPEHESAARRPA
jgi:PadR family transcriptional regulator, regulatory protein AphA